MIDSRDPRQEAFDQLLPAAALTRDALKRVDEAVAREREHVRPLRKVFRVGQRNQSIGFSRFVYAIDELSKAWASVKGLRYASSASQEASNLFLWTLGERWPLRVKHEPVEDGVHSGARRLFEVPTSEADPTIFLTWDESEEGRIVRARFVTVDEPKWSISLSQLIAVAEQPDSMKGSRSLAKVSSARAKDSAATDEQSQ